MEDIGEKIGELNKIKLDLEETSLEVTLADKFLDSILFGRLPNRIERNYNIYNNHIQKLEKGKREYSKELYEKINEVYKLI